MPDNDDWANLSPDEKINRLRQEYGQLIADLRHQIGGLKTQIDRLTQELRNARSRMS